MSALESLTRPTDYSNAGANIAITYDEAPHKVLADVYYSYGYYWHERKDHQKARSLFEESIYALSQAGQDVDWDSPYTRLAILQLIEGETKSAVDLALTARKFVKILSRAEIAKQYLEGYAKPGDELCDHVADLREHRFLIMFSRGFA